MKHVKKDTKKILTIILSFFLITTGIFLIHQFSFSFANSTLNKQITSNYVPSGPISITSDADFGPTGYNFPGNGLINDPYIIEDLNITTTSENGIYILTTTAYFEIRNCYVEADKYGIHIGSAATGTVTIKNNTCVNNGDAGMIIGNTQNTTVVNNTFSNNFQHGIYMSDCANSIIENNTCINNEVALYHSTNSNVYNNTILNDRIFVFHCENSTFDSNDIYGGGLDFLDWDSPVKNRVSYKCANNYVNGKELVFLKNSNDITYDTPDYGQLIIANCSRIKIANQMLKNTTVSIHLFYTNYTTVMDNTIYDDGGLISAHYCNHLLLENNDITYSSYGIRVEYSFNTTIDGNTCNDNSVDGITIYYSHNSTIVNNICNRNHDYLGIEVGNCDYSTIKDNTCLDNEWYGIIVYECKDAIVEGNTCNGHLDDGIRIDSIGPMQVTNNYCENNDNGIKLFNWCTSITLSENKCINNNYGIYLQVASSNIITGNLLENNQEYGIFLSTSSDNNIIHHNTFYNNNPGGTSQAYDDGSNNVWYDTTTNEGNYWDDWVSGDYAIDGSATAVDPYPLNEPLVPPVFEFSLIFTSILFLIPSILLVLCIYVKKRERK